MEASTPRPQKTSTVTELDISPIRAQTQPGPDDSTTKEYSKRQRKPRKWSDFDTSDETTAGSKKKHSKGRGRKSGAVSANESVNDSVGSSSNSKTHDQSIETPSTKAKPGPKKTANKVRAKRDTSDHIAETELHKGDSFIIDIKPESDTSVKPSVGKRRCNIDFKTVRNELPTPVNDFSPLKADFEQLKSMRQAVNSKRKPDSRNFALSDQGTDKQEITVKEESIEQTSNKETNAISGTHLKNYLTEKQKEASAKISNFRNTVMGPIHSNNERIPTYSTKSNDKSATSSKVVVTADIHKQAEGPVATIVDHPNDLFSVPLTQRKPSRKSKLEGEEELNIEEIKTPEKKVQNTKLDSGKAKQNVSKDVITVSAEADVNKCSGDSATASITKENANDLFTVQPTQRIPQRKPRLGDEKDLSLETLQTPGQESAHQEIRIKDTSKIPPDSVFMGKNDSKVDSQKNLKNDTSVNKSKESPIDMDTTKPLKQKPGRKPKPKVQQNVELNVKELKTPKSEKSEEVALESVPFEENKPEVIRNIEVKAVIHQPYAINPAANEIEDSLNVSVTTPPVKRKPGRKPKVKSKPDSVIEEQGSVDDVGGMIGKDDTIGSVKKKRRGRPKRNKENSAQSTSGCHDESGLDKTGSVSECQENESLDVTNSSVNSDSLNVTADALFTPGKRGRKRKAVNYAEMDAGGGGSKKNADDVMVNEKVGNKRKKRGGGRKSNQGLVEDVENAENNENEGDKDVDQEDMDETQENDVTTDETDTGKKRGRKSAKKEKTPKKTSTIQCPQCEFTCCYQTAMVKHCAVTHQMLWSVEHPEGETDKEAMKQVFKLRKTLNCPRCNKLIKFLFYYWQHLEWCGREHEMYMCEYCLKPLKLQWKAIHMRTCPALPQDESSAPADSTDKQTTEQEEEEGETLEPGARRKRKAAKKARDIVQNISKTMESVDHPDDSGDDPDVRIDDEEDEDDEDEYNDDLNDEDVSDDEGAMSEELDEDKDDIIPPPMLRVGHSRKPYGIRPDGPDGHRFFHFSPHKMMEELMRKEWSDTVFPDWTSNKSDWQQLSQSESEPYLPRRKHGPCFSVKADKPRTKHQLNLYESTIAQGTPVFYTGLVIWRIKWCPMPLHTKYDQVLAVVGKYSVSEKLEMYRRYVGPGIVQFWKTGVTNNHISSKTKPQLWFNMVHDYGRVTEMLWCPSGCYQRASTQVEDTHYPRLGLLALALTDGTVRIFSVPNLRNQCDEEAVSFRAKPLLTLIAHRNQSKRPQVCTCIDWLQVGGHCKLMAGYSDGSVRLFHLSFTSALLKHTGDDGLPNLLPVFTFQPHTSAVRAVRWCATLENIVVTSAMNFDNFFWDLTSPRFPLFQDPGFYMTLAMANSVWLNGQFMASDDNHGLHWNRGRYMEARNIMYSPLKRKDDVHLYYISSQFCSIWDVTYSNWLNMVSTCDNKGRVYITPLKDFLYTFPDQKSYKYRLIVSVSEVDTSNVKKDSSQKEDQSDSKVQCKKCQVNQSEDSKVTDQSETANENTSNQSQTSTECTCDKTDQSVQSSGENNQSQENSEKSCDQSDQSGNSSPEKDYNMLPEGAVVRFTEYVKTQNSRLRVDTDMDRYDRISQVALKTVSYNPNHHQFCWLGYGGDLGLVRLVNTQLLLPRATHFTLQKDKEFLNT